MKKHLKITAILFVFFCLINFSCKEKSLFERYATVAGINFSIKQYIFEQWTNYNGQPFAILKTVKINGKTDSIYTNSEKLNWSEIFSVFFETDISSKESLGHYKFTQFEDKEDRTDNYYYEAIDESRYTWNLLDEDQFTRKLLISVEPFTNRIKGIYIETYTRSIFGDTNQKLYYSPNKTIQIQRYEKPMIGSKKSTIIQYYFMR